MEHGMSGTSCPACGCGGHGHEMGGFGMRCGGLKAMLMTMPWKIIMHSDELGLSEEQVEAFRSRHIEAKKQMIRIACEIKIDMIDVKNAVMREEMDTETAKAKAEEIGKLKGEMFAGMIQAMHDMRHILTPDQRHKIKEMVLAWFKKGGMHGMGMEEGHEAESGEMSEE